MFVVAGQQQYLNSRC